jgi:hypothetical protein
MGADDVYEQIRAILDAAEDPDVLRHEVLRRSGDLDRADHRPGDPPPANTLDARWRRALAANPEALLGALRAQHPPSSARVFGRKNEYELTLPNGGGRLLIKWIPGHGG